MNPEVSPWMVIADRQRLMDVERERQERAMKEQIKLQYQKELANQVEEQRMAKKR